ncbi:NAD(P)/FAD-dependent oxidoreductase [Chitinophaga sp. 212800010-3]|uniref:NAD(P)/FAD-dependent oxidoreductase n=1 Tax=unclassified Chitinophaga TaxID=2619133 RepID=UPI002DECE2F8|nr:Pyr-redox-2 domain-containing protein [Chitinophaga sp. 212800010-3]
MEKYEVIITGGSYAGLAAAMSLGRALRRVLVIDSGLPCNRQTPFSHNFLTQDGVAPAAIAAAGRAQVAQYPGISFLQGIVTTGQQTDEGFRLTTADGRQLEARKLLFATGIKDEIPSLKGFAECWGISVLHCPYCHGYEVRQQPTGILARGDDAWEMAKLISNWTDQLTIFSNGPAALLPQQLEKLAARNISVNEKPVSEILHENGRMNTLLFDDGSRQALHALYARPAFRQHCPVPEALGCELTDSGHIKTDIMQATTVPGIFAAGDATTPMRAVAAAVAAGTMAGAAINRALQEEDFNK